MSNFESLIDRLVADTTPVSRFAVAKSLSRVTLMGCGLAIVVVIAIGLRPDLVAAASSSIFWIKLAYGAALAATGMAALALLVRPELPVPRVLGLAMVPFAALSILAAVELMSLSPSGARSAWLGTSWAVCSALIAIIAVPVAASLTWAVRQFAPTHLRATGATIGFTAGAMAAAVYALHCPESGASFVATWYTLGVVLVATLGYLVGPRLLRW
jgi:hypothetical protein